MIVGSSFCCRDCWPGDKVDGFAVVGGWVSGGDWIRHGLKSVFDWSLYVLGGKQRDQQFNR